MPETQKTDLILRNARLIDGTGAPSQYGDVAILNDRLLVVGELEDLQAVREVDVGGKVVCPGFVDTHTHDDHVLLTDPNMSCKVSQGVTTVVTGNCGISLVPLKIDQRPPAPLDILVELKAGKIFSKCYSVRYSNLEKISCLSKTISTIQFF